MKKYIGGDINFKNEVKSNIPIDIIICAVSKDYDVLVKAIGSIRKNIKHPIDNIFLICPISTKIKKIAKDNQCTLINENKVLPITKNDIHYNVNNQDRSGWLFQQLLKFSGDQFSKNEYFLITDSDTIYCRPQVFINNNKVLLPISNQLCHLPYFDAIYRLIGEKIPPVFNVTSHHSLLEKSKLKILKNKIENEKNIPWWQVIINNIDHSQGASFSEYQTYGQFCYKNFSKDFEMEYWFNHGFCKKQLKDLNKILIYSKRKYKNISFHSYSDQE